MSRTAQINKFDKNGHQIVVTIKPQAVNIFTLPQNDLWTFDLEGRPTGMFIQGINYRRTLSNHFFLKDRVNIDLEDFRNVTPIGLGIAWALIQKGHEILKKVRSELPDESAVIIDKIISMDAAALAENGEKYNQIYLPISILPPDQYMALVIQITEGCNYNKCTFCNFYRDRPFRIKKFPDIDSHIDEVLSFFGEGIRLRRSIFLADANALVTPQPRLIEALELIRNKMGNPWKIYSFIDVFTGIHKSSDDFSQLNDLGLERVYLGVESGDPELLDFLHKPQATDEIIELTENLKQGGVNLGVIFLTGAGGEKYHNQHLEASVSLINKLPLGKGDMIYLSEFYETNPEYESALRKNEILQPDRQSIRKMTREFESKFQLVTPNEVIISTYDIQQFLY